MSPLLPSAAAAPELLRQSALIRSWLSALPDPQFEAFSVLAGWDVRTLVGHLLLVHEGLLRHLERPVDAVPLPVHEFVSRYRPAAAMIERSTREVTADRNPDELRSALAAASTALEARLAAPLPRVIETPRGASTAADFLSTRVVELVMHADDLSRSLPALTPVLLDRSALALAARTLARIFAAQAPGRSVELRVPPFVAVQAVPGPRHTRGTPPNVVETDALTWVRLATGRTGLAAAAAAGAVTLSGARADLSGYLPVLS